MRVHILVIDDEESICEILKYNLEKEGYDVDTAYSAEEALELNLQQYQLIIVDIMMDKMSGFDFAKRLKNDPATESIPLIFCSALSGEDDTVMGLNLGADDYITKPFTMGVVIARVRAALRRSNISRHVTTIPTPVVQQQVVTPKPVKEEKPAAQQVVEPVKPSAESAVADDLVFKTLRIDLDDKRCYIGDDPLSLTRNEFDILYFFLTNRNRIHSRKEILQAVWPDDTVVTNRTVDVNIARLRRKLGSYGANITTRLGFGYGFKENV